MSSNVPSSLNVPMHAKSKILSHKDKIFANIVHVNSNGNLTIQSKIITTGPRQPYSFDIGVD